ERVKPAGMAVGILPVIFAVLWFVVTAQLDTALVTLVGALPATAVVIVKVGAPVKAIWLMALTENVTVCVAVWACTAAGIAAPRRAMATKQRRRAMESILGRSQLVSRA